MSAGRRIDGAVRDAPRVSIVVDGRAFEAYAGESLAAALWAGGVTRLGESPRAGHPRGAFCMMGVCQACVVRVDGRAVQACIETVREGMVVERRRGLA